MKPNTTLIKNNVQVALQEDLVTGDITSESLFTDQQAQAKIITREAMVVCGIEWVKATFKATDTSLKSKIQHTTNTTIQWHVKDGDWVKPGICLASLQGQTLSLLMGERTALNFLQTLSGTSTLTHHYCERIKHTHTKLLDTRKTLPGLRYAQKYAVWCGGGMNHRMGLYDACLIKDNHIAAIGSISAAVKQIHADHPHTTIIIEVTSLEELEEALNTPANRILLDNFSLKTLKEAVNTAQGKIPLEASGNIHLGNIRAVAKTGVDYISVGNLTKHLKAIDLSMQFHSHKSVQRDKDLKIA